MREQPGVDPSASPLSKRSTRKTQRDPRNNKSYKRRLEESIVKEMWNPAKFRKQKPSQPTAKCQVLEQHGLQRIRLVPTSVPNSDERLYSEE